MADLASLLKDPNYTGANEATKQAIFDKFSQQDVNFTGANPQTQSAIRAKFGLTNAPAAAPSEWDVTGGPRIGMPAPTPEPTMTQKAWQAARPYVAPLVEGAGAIGGGLIGGGAGTLVAPGVGTATGAVAGAGLGYGMGKELLNLADINLGGQAPRQGAAQITEPISNIIEGAAYEAGGRVIGPALGWAAGKVADIRQLPVQKAAKIARATLGDDLPTVLNNLRNASPTASVAELTAGVNNPAWQSLISKSLERDPATVQMLRKMAITDEAGAVNALAKLAGGSTATATRATGEIAKENLNAITTPMREGALKRANLGKEVAQLESMSAELGEQAANKVQEVRRLMELGDLANASARLNLIKKNLPVGLTKYTYPGELANKAFNEWSNKAAQASLDLGQGARFADDAANALRSVGIKPLEGESLIRNIKTMSSNPEFAGNDVLVGALRNVSDDIGKWTSSGGVIDARALEAIRKNSVNAAIAQLRPGADATSQRNLAAGVMSKIKPMIDNAIESAGGTGWRDYLTTHSKGMAQIAEKKLTGEALNLWKNDKDAFVKLVQGESPDAVEKILGPGKYDIAKEVADNTLSVLQDQARKHLTKVSVQKQASEGGAALATVLDQQVSKFKLPSLLNFWSTVGNKGLEDLEKRLGRSTMNSLTAAMKTPEGAANLLETLPATERNRVINLLSNPSQWKSGTSAGVGIATKNMLAPESENQNALAY